MTKIHDGINCYSGIRALVLGASGFIGRWVARCLCSQGARVFLVVRNGEAAKKVFRQYGIVGEIFEVDLGNGEDIRTLFKIIRPSITFNLAAYGVDPTEGDEKTAYQINAQLVEVICEGGAEVKDTQWSGLDIVHVGSAFEYGGIGGDLSEDSIADPITLYGKSKLAGTKALTRCCRTLNVKGVTARLFTIYGPGEPPGRLLPTLIRTAVTKKPLELTAGKQKRDFTYVGDVAEGLLLLGLAAAKPGDVLNLATGKLTSVRDFAETAARILQIPHHMLKFGEIPTRAEEMEHQDVTIESLRRLIEWAPPKDIEEGIEETIEFGNRYNA